MLFQALAVGFAFVSFMQDSFEAGKFSVHASDLKAAGLLRAICESLCRSKREDGPYFRQVRNYIIKDVMARPRIYMLYYQAIKED